MQLYVTRILYIYGLAQDCRDYIANALKLPVLRHTTMTMSWHGLTLILSWISNYIHYNVWDEITYPFLSFNGCTVEV